MKARNNLINSFYDRYMFKRGRYFAQWQEWIYPKRLIS